MCVLEITDVSIYIFCVTLGIISNSREEAGALGSIFGVCESCCIVVKSNKKPTNVLYLSPHLTVREYETGIQRVKDDDRRRCRTSRHWIQADSLYLQKICVLGVSAALDSDRVERILYRT